MQDKDERLFKYIQARITQTFHETWYHIFVQSTTFVLPWLICLCILHRIVFSAGVTLEEFDFKSTIEKIQEVTQH